MCDIVLVICIIYINRFVDIMYMYMCYAFVDVANPGRKSLNKICNSNFEAGIVNSNFYTLRMAINSEVLTQMKFIQMRRKIPLSRSSAP